ncbi:MAG: protein kinase [Chthoniobacteraceae bacterium]
MNTPEPHPVPKTCQQCGQPILEGSPRGLCALCLISAVVKSDGPPAPDFPAPELDDLRRAFPSLEILELLGVGGMGRVYKARQPHLDRLVALKLLPTAFAEDPAWVERFKREARALARLNHPNIVQIYDVGEAVSNEGESAVHFPYLLMEFVDGVNLRQTLRSGTMTAREALSIVPSICAALQYAHDRGVLHRDIKPENILLDTTGQVKIADFGLAKLGNEAAPGVTLTGTGMQLGTVAYMAPEQIEHPGEVDHRADIYSVGVVFYELLTGELPLGRFPAPSEKSGSDPRLDTVVFRTLEKERERRYQSASEMQSEVETIAGTPAPIANPKEWMIRCATCGRTTPLSAVGGFRKGAASIGKRTLIRCSNCGKMREGIITQRKDLPSGTMVSDPPPPPVDPLADKPWWPTALVFGLLLLPIAVLMVALGLPILMRSGMGGLGPAEVWILIGLAPIAYAATIALLTWFYRRLRRANLSGLAAGLTTALLIIVMPAGCTVASALWVYAAARQGGPRSTEGHRAEVVPPGQFWMEKTRNEGSSGDGGGFYLGEWKIRSGEPASIVMSDPSGKQSVRLARDSDGYSGFVRISLDWKGDSVSAEEVLGSKDGTTTRKPNFSTPTGNLAPELFKRSASRGYRPFGEHLLLNLGPNPVMITVAPRPDEPSIQDAAPPTGGGRYLWKTVATSEQEGEKTTTWEMRGDFPLWVQVAFGGEDAEFAGQQMSKEGEVYSAQFTATLKRLPKQNDFADLTYHLKVGGRDYNGTVQQRVTDPDWYAKALDGIPGDGWKEFGALPIFQLGDQALRLRVSPLEKDPIEDVSKFKVEDVGIENDNGALHLRLDYEDQSTGNSELYFRSEGLPEPVVAPFDGLVSDRPVAFVRRVWQLPKGIDDAAAEKIREHIATQYVSKKIPHHPGQWYPLFLAKKADGSPLNVFVGARTRNNVGAGDGQKSAPENREEELIFNARQHLNFVGQQTQALPIAAAERELAIAEARGDEVKIATANLALARTCLSHERVRRERGYPADIDLVEAERVVKEAEQELEAARAKAGPGSAQGNVPKP